VVNFGRVFVVAGGQDVLLYFLDFWAVPLVVVFGLLIVGVLVRFVFFVVVVVAGFFLEK